MNNKTALSPDRRLTPAEQKLIWQKPSSHIESAAELRIYSEVKRKWDSKEMRITNILLEGDAGSGKTQLAKALSADFDLPYTKITCFADMDKSDILGSILPVLSEKASDNADIQYEFYPSEIVRAYENGWLLEIQEPTVIRDAAVLMALNSALEPDGSINLPTRIVHRHPDFVAVITTNRGYNGCRPLNEALRDRIHHTEKMDLPPKAVMIERAIAKTGYAHAEVLSLLADSIITLDIAAKANAIKGVAGMRSYLYWIDAVASSTEIRSAMYHKVIYKITTDAEEIAILEQALKDKELLEKIDALETDLQTSPDGIYEHTKDLTRDSSENGLNNLNMNDFSSNQDTLVHENKPITDESDPINPETMALYLDKSGKYQTDEDKKYQVPNPIRLQKSDDSTGHSDSTSDNPNHMTSSKDLGEDKSAFYHNLEDESENPEQARPSETERKAFRKRLNQEARESVKNSMHENIKLIVHRPEITAAHKAEYLKQAAALAPVIDSLVHKTTPLLEYETTAEIMSGKLYGTSFQANRLASQDFRYFARKNPPTENPSLVLALRIDESASMNAFGRLEAAKQAAIAIYEFCHRAGIPVMIYGDTADKSKMEQMSLYAYADFDSRDAYEKYALAGITARSNNRDGMAIRILADKLITRQENTKLFISISDGQPKSVPDYTGALAIQDMKTTLQEYRRKGILFLAAAIGQDKEIISEIYGKENTLDITDLGQLPARLIQIISRFL